MTKFNNEGRELSLYIENDRRFVGNLKAWKANYAKKMIQVIYNRELALKGIRNNLIPYAAKLYCEEFGGIPAKVFNKEARDFAAKEVLDQIEDDLLND